MKKILRIIILLYFDLVMANNFSDELLQNSCIAIGNNLISQCVDTTGDVYQCSILYSNYVGCITQLNQPLDLIYRHDLDNLSHSEFSPCGYEVSHLLLNQKCY